MVVGADVQHDWQALVRIDARQSGVERQLADRNAHAVAAQVAETENSLAVRDHDRLDTRLGPVANDVVDVALVVDGDEQASGKE